MRLRQLIKSILSEPPRDKLSNIPILFGTSQHGPKTGERVGPEIKPSPGWQGFES